MDTIMVPKLMQFKDVVPNGVFYRKCSASPEFKEFFVKMIKEMPRSNEEFQKTCGSHNCYTLETGMPYTMSPDTEVFVCHPINNDLSNFCIPPLFEVKGGQIYRADADKDGFKVGPAVGLNVQYKLSDSGEFQKISQMTMDPASVNMQIPLVEVQNKVQCLCNKVLPDTVTLGEVRELVNEIVYKMWCISESHKGE